MNRIYEQVGDVVTTLAPAIVPKLDTQIKVMAWKKREQKDPRLNDLLWRISNLYFIEDKSCTWTGIEAILVPFKLSAAFASVSEKH